MITKKFKLVTLALITSVGLNIALIISLSCFSSESVVSFSKSKNVALKSNSQVFLTLSRLSFRELVSFLTNRELLEEGFTKRDLAVAALTNFHHFNLEKAINQKPSKVRVLSLATGQKVEVYPGLEEDQFEAIIRFAYQEKWPLTSKGLYLLLQNQKEPKDESLEQAFFHTPEFYALKLLFQKTNASQDPKSLLDLALETNWQMIERYFANELKDFSVETRRSFLVEAMKAHSEKAAEMILKVDFDCALKSFDDKSVLDLLALIKRQTDVGTDFCIELLKSPRSDSVWQAAAQTLYAYLGEMPTLPIEPKKVLARFSKNKVKDAPQKLSPPQEMRLHVVKDGESLWKISREYKVKVDEIIRVNGLDNDSLFPGMTLKIP